METESVSSWLGPLLSIIEIEWSEQTSLCLFLLSLVSCNDRLPAVSYGRAQTGYLCQMDLTLNL